MPFFQPQMTPPTAPPQAANQPDLNTSMNKIIKDGTSTLSSLIQQHISNGYQSLIQSGVPVADAAKHILGDLLKMSTVGPGNVGGFASAIGGGNQPPGQPNNPNGGGQPPPNVPAAIQQPDADVFIAGPSEDPAAPAPNQPSQGSQPDLYAGMPQSQGGINPLNVLGNLLNTFTGMPIAQTPELRFGQDMARQAMFGQTPQGKFNYAKAERGLPMTSVEDAQYGKTGIEERKLQAGGYAAQREAYSNQIKDTEDQETNLLKELAQVKDLPGGALFQRDKISEIQTNLQYTRANRDSIQQQLDALSPQQPNFKPTGSNQNIPPRTTHYVIRNGKPIFMDSKGKVLK